MRLPREVKNLIYNYAFGSNLIHIVDIADVPYEGVAQFRNSICRAEVSEEEAQRNFDSESEDRWVVPANDGRHERCRCPQSATSSDGKEEKPKIFNLGALRCCRQMYNEAHYIPYSANTFAYADSHTLQSFILSLSKGAHQNHLAVRSLFLEMIYTTLPITNADWSKALNTCVSKCKNVENVNIGLDMRCWYWKEVARSPAAFEAKGPRWQTPFMSDILVLKELPLKSATCVINDAEIDKGRSLIDALLIAYNDPTRWTLEEKRMWARYVREIILR